MPHVNRKIVALGLLFWYSIWQKIGALNLCNITHVSSRCQLKSVKITIIVNIYFYTQCRAIPTAAAAHK